MTGAEITITDHIWTPAIVNRSIVNGGAVIEDAIPNAGVKKMMLIKKRLINATAPS